MPLPLGLVDSEFREEVGCRGKGGRRPRTKPLEGDSWTSRYQETGLHMMGTQWTLARFPILAPLHPLDRQTCLPFCNSYIHATGNGHTLYLYSVRLACFALGLNLEREVLDSRENSLIASV